MTVAVNGFHSQAMQSVVAAFEDGFTSGREVGASLSVIRSGETLLDSWAGHTDRARQQLWEQDTLACCFSVSKAVTALAALRAVDQGFLKLDETMASYWPEYAQHGKAETTVRQVFAHQAGLPGFQESVDTDIYYNWERVCNLLAGTEPW